MKGAAARQRLPLQTAVSSVSQRTLRVQLLASPDAVQEVESEVEGEVESEVEGRGDGWLGVEV